MNNEVRLLKNRFILLKCGQRENEGFRMLIELYERPLFYYLRRFMEREEDAWDVLQEVWVKVMRSISSVKSAGTLTPWLYRIARNTMIDHQRRERRCEPLPEDDGPGALIDDTKELDWGYLDTAAAIHEGLAHLPPTEREVLTLFFLEEFSIQEIAEIAGAPVGTIKSRLHRARGNLRVLLTREKGQ